jgi:hypothetical protein
MMDLMALPARVGTRALPGPTSGSEAMILLVHVVVSLTLDVAVNPRRYSTRTN